MQRDKQICQKIYMIMYTWPCSGENLLKYVFGLIHFISSMRLKFNTQQTILIKLTQIRVWFVS